MAEPGIMKSLSSIDLNQKRPSLLDVVLENSNTYKEVGGELLSSDTDVSTAMFVSHSPGSGRFREVLAAFGISWCTQSCWFVTSPAGCSRHPDYKHRACRCIVKLE